MNAAAWGFAQWIVLTIFAVKLAQDIWLDGKPVRPRRYNRIHGIVAVMVWLALLQWGGFFD